MDHRPRNARFAARERVRRFRRPPLARPRYAAAALALAAGAALFAGGRARLAIAAAFGAAALALAAPGPAHFLGSAYDEAPVLHADHGVQDTVGIITVDLPAEPRIRRIVSNGVSYSGDSIFAQRYMRLLAHLPALAARGDERALLICLGTGTTLHALRTHAFDAIIAVDISPSVRETLHHFAHVNEHADRARGVEVVIDDGVRFLRRTRERYDVITLEPPPPRAPGGSALYTRELYEDARARLNEGGAIAQWLPLHGMTGGEARALIRTFLDVFPGASFHLAERNEAILLATAGEGASAEARRARRSRDDVAHDLGAIGAGASDLLADTLVLAGDELRALAGPGPVVRDAWPMPEYAPLASGDEPLDAFLDALASRARPEAHTSAAFLAPVMAPFVRIQEGRGSSADRGQVASALRAWLETRPDDPYLQHVFGFGPLLEARLDRVAPSLSPAALERVRALHARQQRAAAE